jgi:hypothetical protein
LAPWSGAQRPSRYLAEIHCEMATYNNRDAVCLRSSSQRPHGNRYTVRLEGVSAGKSLDKRRNHVDSPP